MNTNIGRIEIPLSLVEEIEERLGRACLEFEIKYKGYFKPKYIVLNRVAFGALKARSRQIPDFYISHPLSLTEFRGTTIICYPTQGELVKCLLDAEDAFFNQDFE